MRKLEYSRTMKRLGHPVPLHPPSQERHVIAFQLGVDSWCNSSLTFEGEYKNYPQAATEWRAKHAALISEMEKVPAYLTAYGDGLSSVSKRYGVMDRAATAPCVDSWRRLLSSNP